MEASISSGETLADVLGARARRTPSDRLVLDIVGGLLVSAAAVWARPTGWFSLLAAALCFACYGCWAITERRLGVAPSSTSASPSASWRVLRHTSAVLGLVAFVLLLFGLLGIALGPIKS